MSTQITRIRIPKQFYYLGDYLSSTNQEYDLPHNAYIMKGLTGVGGTTIALDNDQHYVIACHTTALIREKCNQQEYQATVLGITSDTSDEKIISFVADGGKKMMITYDSIPRLEHLIDITKFRLLVDEVQQLIKYLGGFKTHVCIRLLQSAFNFKSTSFMTATSTSIKYLPKPIQQLSIIEYVWEGATIPQIKKCQVVSNMSEKILSFTVNVLDNSDDEIYIFYNSRFGVVSFIKKILKIKPTFNIKDINVMFSQTIDNTEFFKKHLGKDFEYGSAPTGHNNKKINLISSMGFEGIDFYPNKTPHINPITLIVSDPKSKSMRYDISVDVVQIIGRFRADKETGIFPRNDLYFIWNTYTDTLCKTKEEYEHDLCDRIKNTVNLFKQITNNPLQKEALIALAEKQNDNITILEDPYETNEYKKQPMINPYAYESAMSIYDSIHNDYKSMTGSINVISNRLDNIADTELFDIGELTATYIKLLGRQPSLRKICQELEQIEADMLDNKHDSELTSMLCDEYNKLLILHPQIKEWIDAGMSLQRFKALSYTRDTIQQEYARITVIKSNEELIDTYLNLQVGAIYTRDDIINRLAVLYKDLSISKKIKATDIQQWYDVKSSPKNIKGHIVSAFKIIGRK